MNLVNDKRQPTPNDQVFSKYARNNADKQHRMKLTVGYDQCSEKGDHGG